MRPREFPAESVPAHSDKVTVRIASMRPREFPAESAIIRDAEKEPGTELQ